MAIRSLLGADTAELKARMEKIIEAEAETVKVMKKLIDSNTALTQAIAAHQKVMEQLQKKI